MSRASDYQRFGTTTQAPGSLGYYLQQTGGNVQQARAELEAKNAGFSNAAAQQANRQMRNQLEMKAAMTNTPISEAYGMVQGDLTNTQALQDAWNRLTIQPPAPAPPPPGPPPGGGGGGGTTPPPSGPSRSELMAQSLQQSIAAMQQNYMQSMQQQAQQFQQMQEAQNARMESLQNMMIQAQASQAERPTVVGVQSATGSSGTPMQIARRGVSGAFGRRGMRIKALNV